MGIGGKPIQAVATRVKLKIGHLPTREYEVLITPIKEWIIGMDILRGMTLHLDDGCFKFGGMIQARPVLVGRVKMPPFPIPLANKVVQMKQYRIPGGNQEITDTVKDYVAAGVLKPVTTQWNNPIWPVKKSDGSWRMTVDYRALNKHTPPLTAAVPDTISIIERIQGHEGEWYAVIDLANAFFTIPIPEDRQEQFAFTWGGRQYTFTRLPQGYLHSPTICHRIVAEHLDEVTCPPDVQISHYIDDILIQGVSQQVVQLELDKIISHMKTKGWEINPDKIQGSAQTVKFLGIQWNKGEREIVPKAKQKIMEFATPQTKIDVQKFIGLFGYWRHHIPHLSQILSPLYKVTRKKHDFVWGPEQQIAFDLAKEAIQQAMSLARLMDGPVELQVSASDMYANWSLWQKQEGKRRPLGFWSRKLPDPGVRYTPFEQQLLACYWALLETEQLTLNHAVLIRPRIPIMSWVNSNPKTHRIGGAQESSILKWKWYLADRTKPGQTGVSVLHEQIADAPEKGEDMVVLTSMQDSPVKWGKPYNELTDQEKDHAWFTDGSAKYIGGKRRWKAVAFNPKKEQILEMTGEGRSSQWAELQAVAMVLQQEGISECHIYTDSWSVANGMAVWMGAWQQQNWRIHTKEVWGKDLWNLIWEKVKIVKTYVSHVDAHTTQQSAEALFNATVDAHAKIDLITVQPPTMGLSAATWAHVKSGHLGASATYQWAMDRGISITMDEARTATHQCTICQHYTKKDVPQVIRGQISRGIEPAQVWQMDFIGPLTLSKGCKYVCTAVDTYSGVLVAFPCKRANQASTLNTLQLIEQYYGMPLQIQTDNGTHFTGTKIKEWASSHGVEWIYHISYYPQASGLIERLNGLLKRQLKMSGERGDLVGWRDRLGDAVKVLNNRPLTKGQTPLMRLKIQPMIVEECQTQPVRFWVTDPEARLPIRGTSGSAGLDLYSLTTVTLNPQEVTIVETGVGMQCPPGHYGQICPRSSLAIKGVIVLAGVIDSDYQGTIKVVLQNTSEVPLPLNKGSKVARILIKPVHMGNVEEIPKPSVITGRGEGGFGSTDKSGAKVWVEQHDGPPKPAEIIAMGQDNTVAVMEPGEERWRHVPANKCYLRES